MFAPTEPKIYHTLHWDRLPSIVTEGLLLCDSLVATRGLPGTNIGINKIKRRRLYELSLRSHPGLFVGDCVPFYFCPRSVMLYAIFRAGHSQMTYHGGQDPIIHLEADLRRTITWADSNNRRWAFTSSNAGAYRFQDYSNLAQLDQIDWDAIQATVWRDKREARQAEFLVERSFPLSVISRIGVRSHEIRDQVLHALQPADHRPPVEVMPDWYY